MAQRGGQGSTGCGAEGGRERISVNPVWRGETVLSIFQLNILHRVQYLLLLAFKKTCLLT